MRSWIFYWTQIDIRICLRLLSLFNPDSRVWLWLLTCRSPSLTSLQKLSLCSFDRLPLQIKLQHWEKTTYFTQTPDTLLLFWNIWWVNVLSQDIYIVQPVCHLKWCNMKYQFFCRKFNIILKWTDSQIWFRLLNLLVSVFWVQLRFLPYSNTNCKYNCYFWTCSTPASTQKLRNYDSLRLRLTTPTLTPHSVL